MSFLFGKKKKEPELPPTEDLGVTSMRLGKSMEDTQLKLEAINAQLKNQLKKMRETRNPQLQAQEKKKAMLLLKKKRMYENQLNTLSNTQMTVENANLDIQMMNDNLNVMRVMANTVKVQKDTLHAMGGIIYI